MPERRIILFYERYMRTELVGCGSDVGKDIDKTIDIWYRKFRWRRLWIDNEFYKIRYYGILATANITTKREQAIALIGETNVAFPTWRTKRLWSSTIPNRERSGMLPGLQRKLHA